MTLLESPWRRSGGYAPSRLASERAGPRAKGASMVTATHAANTRASPERTAQVLFDPETLPLQSPGARVLSVEPSWPATNSKMTFKVMGATVEARVSENRLPEALTLVIQSSAATTTVHHQFVRLPDG